MQKLYCYVDETGQDVGSEFFVVVAVVSDKDQDDLRKKLFGIEKASGTYGRKWHKSSKSRRINYIKLVIEQKICKGEIFFGYYKKPIPYFFPMLETIEQAIKKKAKRNYSVSVYVDGIDKKKARELTNALRKQNLKIAFVKSRRDESEPLIRLADMWAGCIRGYYFNKQKEKELIKQAKKKKYLREI